MVGKLKENLSEIQMQIDRELKAHPALKSPRILAVSKKQPLQKIEELFALGISDFAENYLQEAKIKMEKLRHLPICWHYIGSIQTNKLNDLVGRFDLIHSVAREVEIKKIAEIARKKEIQQNFLIQVNIANESTKGGSTVDQLDSLIAETRRHTNIALRGLMIFPPLSESEEESLEWFAKAQALYLDCQKQLGSGFDRLSMGTSGDFHLALRKGATDLRIGERLFGARTD